ADQDGPVALLAGQARRREADHDGVVAGEHQVDEDDLEEGAQRFGGNQFAHAAPFARLERGRRRYDPVRRKRPRNGWATTVVQSDITAARAAARGARPGDRISS